MTRSERDSGEIDVASHAAEARRFLTRTIVERGDNRVTYYSLNVQGNRAVAIAAGAVTSIAAIIAIAFHLLTLALWPTIDARARAAAISEIDDAVRTKGIVPYNSWQAHLRERDILVKQTTDTLDAITNRLEKFERGQDKIIDLLINERRRGSGGGGSVGDGGAGAGSRGSRGGAP